jgi:hypothetical protein
MLQVGFEPTISEFERSEIVHVSDRTANVIDFTQCKAKKKKVKLSLYLALKAHRVVRR